jgi:hypothetical protein
MSGINARVARLLSVKMMYQGTLPCQHFSGHKVKQIKLHSVVHWRQIVIARMKTFTIVNHLTVFKYTPRGQNIGFQLP